MSSDKRQSIMLLGQEQQHVVFKINAVGKIVTTHDIFNVPSTDHSNDQPQQFFKKSAALHEQKSHKSYANSENALQ